MKKKITLSGFIKLFIMMVVCTLAFSSNVSARTQKQKAMAAYKKLLNASKYQARKKDGYSHYYLFATACIDNDSVPELLIVKSRGECLDGGNGKLITYKNGKAKCLGSISFADGSEFPKTSLRYAYKGSLLYDNRSDGCCSSYYFYRCIVGNKLMRLPYEKIVSSDLSILDWGYADEQEGTVYGLNTSDDEKEISLAEYNEGLAPYLISKKWCKFSFHKNTSTNRKKYLK